MTIIFDGPPGTKLGEGEIDGMHELLAGDDFPVWELELDDEDEDLEKAAAATPSTAQLCSSPLHNWRRPSRPA